MSKTIVLVAEDDPAIRKALKAKLTAMGYQLILAKNGQEALDLATKKHPDLFIIDILMPVMYGLEMLEKVRKAAWGKTIPAIILTNIDDNTFRRQAEELKAMYFLKASTKLEDLMKTIHDSLN